MVLFKHNKHGFPMEIEVTKGNPSDALKEVPPVCYICGEEFEVIKEEDEVKK